MSKETNLTYSGDIRGIVAEGKQIAFVTEHVEGFSTSLFLIDGETNKLESVALPTGGLSLAKLGGTYWIGGADGALYSGKAKDKSTKAAKIKLPSAAKRMVGISDTELVCLCNHEVCVVSTQNKLIQTLSIEANGNQLEATAAAASPDGQWLAIGCVDGTVFVFERENGDAFNLSESAQLHQGEVTAMLFDAEELRFFSVAKDQKLLVTHARGVLGPEDRGRANNHNETIVAMVLAGVGRFITGSRDKSCKSWARSGMNKPSTLSDGLVAVTGLAVATIHKRSTLVAANSDNSIRLFLIDDVGKLGQPTARYNDGMKRVRALFESNSTADRGAALHELAGYDDLASIELIAKQIEADADVKLRLTAAELLCKSSHPQHHDLLQSCLKNGSDTIRQTVFDYLANSQSDDLELLRLCESAIKTGYVEIGCNAVKIAERLACDPNKTGAFRNRASDLIVQAFSSPTSEIRRTGILAFESTFDKKSSRPNLIALKSGQPDARRIALIRLMQRKLLGDREAAAGIRRKIEDVDPDVRKTATLLLVLSRKKLAEAIRARDPNVDRQLSDLDAFSIDFGSSTKTKKIPKSKSDTNKPASTAAKKAKGNKLPVPKLSDKDLQPLLIAVSSRSMDTCLLGAKCLALLEDPRAFGILMQLSREEDELARVEVCQALAALGDSRANERLASLLADESVNVRDAAYTALVGIRPEEPLAVATNGMSAAAEDVRRRALETLVKYIRATKPKTADDPAMQLLLQALNDEAVPIRNESFKFILNSKVGGGHDKSLRLILNSIHADVRREVLTEAMAQEKEKWARPLLLDLLDDPSPEIRADGFSYLKKESKDSDISWLENAIGRSYVDIRLAACKQLVSNRTAESRKVLLAAIDDSDQEVRQTVLISLIDRGATEQLKAAIKSEQIDVRLGAAVALAQRGDPASRDALVAFASQPKPTVASFQASWDGSAEASADERDLEKFEAIQKAWQSMVVTAHLGLSRLGDPSTLGCVLNNLKSEDEKVRTALRGALAWIGNEETLDLVRPFMQHASEPVKSHAAFAMVMGSDPIGLPQVFSTDAKSIEPVQAFSAAVVLGERTESRLIKMLDSATLAIRNSALIVLLCREYALHDGSPRQLTACLAARDPRIRLLAAKAVESFGDDDAFFEVLKSVFNVRGDAKPWTIESEAIEKIVGVICNGSKQLVARLVWFFPKLGREKQNVWNDQWRAYSERFVNEIAAATKQLNRSRVTASSEELSQLAFGTYVGLAREQGGYHDRGSKPGFGATVVSVRAAAIRRLVAISLAEKSFRESTISVLMQTAGDPNQEVRRLAFEELARLGVDNEERASIAIETGHRDLAISGLTLLTSSGKKSEQVELLKNIVLSRNDEIALEAAKLLKNRMDEVEVAKFCFDSPYMELPVIATSWLAASFDGSAAAKKVIRALASESEDAKVRLKAIRTLVAAKDDHAFDCLTKAIQSEEEKVRPQYLSLFGQLADPRGPDFLLDRLEEDQQLDGKSYIAQSGLQRDPKIAARLIEKFETWPQWRDAIFSSLLRISGYDQPINDPNDVSVDQSYLERQFPRHNDVLASLVVAVNRFGTVGQLKKLIPFARWANGDHVDASLFELAIHSDDGVRHLAIEALGFRGEKRNTDVGSLVDALDHRDPVTKFMAAESLARSGSSQGIQILLAAIELMDDLGLRRRAVLALGRLADERAFDLLIRLAAEDGHALQDSAAEAIGHLKNSEHQTKIVKTLLRLVAGGGSAANRALIGLRWLDASEGWEEIRDLAGQQTELRWVAIEQLGYDESQTSKDLLLKMLEAGVKPDWILGVARRSWGEESIAPELAWLKSGSEARRQRNTLEAAKTEKRIRELATHDQIIDSIPYCSDAFRRSMMQHLITRDPPPTKIAVSRIEDASPAVVETCAWIIGRTGDSENASTINAALVLQLEEAKKLDQQMALENSYSDSKLDSRISCLNRLVWAAGILGGLEKDLAQLVVDLARSTHLEPVRLSAVQALAQSQASSTSVSKILAPFLDDHNGEVRRLVGEVMANSPKSKIPELAEQLISDRAGFALLAENRLPEISSTIKSAAADTHYQPRALPYLIENDDVKTLEAVANDGAADHFARMGAVEGLAQIAKADSEKALLAIGNNESFDEDLRKVAWRGLRRSKRRRISEAT